jgi:hypothetical protein
MKKPLFALLVALIVLACSKVNQENFLKIRDGMSEEEVIAILGRANESNSVNLLGISGTASRWVAGDTVITVRFVNGQVAFKSFDKAGAGGK